MFHMYDYNFQYRGSVEAINAKAALEHAKRQPGMGIAPSVESQAALNRKEDQERPQHYWGY